MRHPFYLLAGATATGKTAVANFLAREMGAAILSADSMLVYKGMDIGTAKPTMEERRAFDMGGIDLVTPAEPFSCGAWLRAAEAWDATLEAGRPVIMTGGTGLYFSTLLRGLDRAWVKPPPEYPVLEVADRALRRARIDARVDAMLLAGLAEEVKRLRQEYPVWSQTASAAIGYKEFGPEVIATPEVRELICVRTRHYAKRQDTWFRHQAQAITIPAAETLAETAARVRSVWEKHGPWQV